MHISIRNANEGDAEALLALYAYYVEQTAISFEHTRPTAEEFRGRIRTTLSKYPYLVAEADGEVAGYAYAGVFHARASYAHCCELSIYVAKDRRKDGIGRLLYTELERRLGQMGFRNLYACIAVPQGEDDYLDENSRHFHAHMGYREVGHFHGCGIKFGHTYDMVYMEKLL